MNNKEIREQLIAARDEYIGLIKAELMGPGSEFVFPEAEHELISSSPLMRYSVGILFPQGNLMAQDNDETVIICDIIIKTDIPVKSSCYDFFFVLSYQFFQSFGSSVFLCVHCHGLINPPVPS